MSAAPITHLHPRNRREGISSTRQGGGPLYRLAGDPESGFGFYPLPIHYRIGAWRYRVSHQRPPWQNPVLFAIAADAARYNYWIPTDQQSYHYGVFNPYDGVGTPFFAGYYGPAGMTMSHPLSLRPALYTLSKGF